jgi:pimeloyl-ACP methyl ester carboxylesterase
MEQVRQAIVLGGDTTAEKLTLIGYSYGTFIMHRYASLYPDHVRLVYADSMVSRKASDIQTVTESHIAFDKSWDVFKRWCDGTVTCALHGQNLDQIFDTAMARARTGTGIPAPNGSFSQEPANDWVFSLSLGATTVAGVENFGLTTQMLADAVAGPTGDASLARDLYVILTGGLSGYDPEGAGTHRAIACLDYTFSQWLNTPAKVKAFEVATDLAAPHFGRSALYQGALQCYKYPATPEAAPVNSPVPASVPILVVSATEDASTPLIWAQRATSEMANGRLLVRDGDGHLNYRFSACVRAYAEVFLLTGQRPANNTHCASDPVEVSVVSDSDVASLQQDMQGSLLPSANDLRNRLELFF